MKPSEVVKMADGCSGSSSFSVHQLLENVCLAFQSFAGRFAAQFWKSVPLTLGVAVGSSGRAARACFTPSSVAFASTATLRGVLHLLEKVLTELQIPPLTLGSPNLREMPTLKATIPLECLFSSKHHPVNVPAINPHISHLR